MPPPGAPKPTASLTAHFKHGWTATKFDAKSGRPDWSDTDAVRLELFERYKARGLGWTSPVSQEHWVFCPICALPYKLRVMELDHIFEWGTIKQRLDAHRVACNAAAASSPHAPPNTELNGFQPFLSVPTSGGSTYELSDWGARAYSEDLDNLHLLCGNAGQRCNQKKNAFANDVEHYFNSKAREKNIFAEPFVKATSTGRLTFEGGDTSRPVLDGTATTLAAVIDELFRITSDEMRVKVDFIKELTGKRERLDQQIAFTTHSTSLMPAPFTQIAHQFGTVLEDARATLEAVHPTPANVAVQFLTKEIVSLDDDTRAPMLTEAVETALGEFGLPGDAVRAGREKKQKKNPTARAEHRQRLTVVKTAATVKYAAAKEQRRGKRSGLRAKKSEEAKAAARDKLALSAAAPPSTGT